MRFVVTFSIFVVLAAPGQMLAQFGDCTAPIRTEWLPDGRRMRLLEDYRYLDPAGKVWLAPRDAIIDGASIPQFLWVTGGPFEGKYRNASVVHDVACLTQTEPWQAVHQMFFDAMRCSGVTRVRASAMYYAVYHCGPRWPGQNTQLCDPSTWSRDFLLRLAALVRDDPDLSPNQLSAVSRDRIMAVEDPIATLERTLGDRVQIADDGTTVRINIEFGFDQVTSPTVSSVSALVGAALRDLPVRIAIEGHTDDIGTAEYNFALGVRRAETVRGTLLAAGLDQNSVTAVSMGEERPLFTNNVPELRDRNRRAELGISFAW